MGGQRDVLDDMIDEMGRRHATAAYVLSTNESRLDDITRDALEFVGWYAIRRGRAYAIESVPTRLTETIKAGREFSSRWSGGESLDKADRETLAVVGLLTLAGARLPRREERH